MANAFFSDLLSTISERGRVLLGRASPANDKQDASELLELCEALLSGRGEASGTAMAREVLDRYHHLDAAGRLSFFQTLARDFGPDHARLAQAIGPGTGRLRHGAAAQAVLLARFHILGDHTDHLPRLTQQLHHAHAIERLAAIGACFAQHALHQAGIVGHCVEEARAAEQAILADARRQVAQLLQRVE